MEVKAIKPSDLKKDEEVETWERRLKLSEDKLKEKSGDMHNRQTSTQGWKQLLNFVKGNQWREGQGGKKKTFDRITANQAKSNIDSIRPQLYFQNPRIKISIKNPMLASQDIPEMQTTPMGPMPVMQQGPPDPMTGQPKPVPVLRIKKGDPVAIVGGQTVDARQQCELMEAVDNYTFVETRAKTKIKRIINDALILPYGVAKWEWIVETEESDELDKSGKPTGNKIEKVVRQYAELNRVKPWCFIWDSELDEFDIENSPWVAEIKYLSEEEIREDKSLGNVDELPEPSYYVDNDYTVGNQQDIEEFARYKVFEIHDLKHGEFLVWIEGSEKINRKESPSPYRNVEGSIYTVLGFDDVPDESFPLSIIDQVKSKAEAYNKVLSYMVNHVARFNRKYKQLKGTMDEAELEKWERGEDGVTVTVKDMNAGPEPINDANINPDVYKVAGILKSEITEDIGVSAYQRSGREPGVDTAFEANLIQGGADIKIQEKRDTVKEFCVRIIKKLNQILKDNADTPTIIKIAGEMGERWVKWTNEDIKGEFIEDVDIYSSMPFSEEVEKKQAMEMYSLAAVDPFFNPFKVRQQVVRVFKWPDDLLYSQEEYAQIQQEQQKQAAEQQAQIENQKQQSRNIRPSKGPESSTVRNNADQKAAISGQARNLQ